LIGAGANLEQENGYRLLLALRENGRLSKRELGNLCDLSRPTVDKIIDRFLKQGLVQQDGYRKSLGGRRPALYKFNERVKYALGVDFEIPELNIVLSDLNGRPLCSKSLQITDLEEPRSAIGFITRAIGDLLSEVEVSPERIIGMGFGAPAFLKDDTITISGRTLPRWTEVPAKKMLEELLNIPVFVDNDAKFMSLAESHHMGYNDEVLVYCALRRGLRGEVHMGGSALIRGEIFRGARGNAVSLQNAYVELEGGLERALSRQPRETIARLRDALLEPMAHMIMLFDPQHVIINAAILGEHEARFLEECTTALRERLGQIFAWEFQIEAAQDRELTCAKGAALFVLQDLFSRPGELLERLVQ